MARIGTLEPSGSRARSTGETLTLDIEQAVSHYDGHRAVRTDMVVDSI